MERLDEFSKLLAESVPRRESLRSIGAFAAGAVLSSLGVGTACCNGTCTAVNSDANNCGACGIVCQEPTPVCIQGTCGICPPPYTVCSGVCTNLQSSANNCGACGFVCSLGQQCVDGVCRSGGE